MFHVEVVQGRRRERDRLEPLSSEQLKEWRQKERGSRVDGVVDENKTRTMADRETRFQLDS